MAVFANDNGKDLTIKVETKDGAVSLKHNGYTFCRCFTTAEGDHMIEVIDADTGVRSSHKITLLCSRR